jgi:hypothetical protein
MLEKPGSNKQCILLQGEGEFLMRNKYLCKECSQASMQATCMCFIDIAVKIQIDMLPLSSYLEAS